MNSLKFVSKSFYSNLLRSATLDSYCALHYAPQCILRHSQKKSFLDFLQYCQYSTARGNFEFASLFHQYFSILHTHYPLSPFYNIYRLKSSKSRKKKGTEDESSDEEDSDDEDNWILQKGPNFKDVKNKVTSIRIDIIASTGFGISRRDVEKAFYGGRISMNGQKIRKKSAMVYEGDKLDLRQKADSDDDTNQFFRMVLLKIGKYPVGVDKVPVLIRKYTKPFASIAEADAA